MDWGVMFNDGSVRHPWNGPTQRKRAEEEAERLAEEYKPDNITLAVRNQKGQWKRYGYPS